MRRPAPTRLVDLVTRRSADPLWPMPPLLRVMVTSSLRHGEAPTHAPSGSDTATPRASFRLRLDGCSVRVAAKVNGPSDRGLRRPLPLPAHGVPKVGRVEVLAQVLNGVKDNRGARLR